MDLSDIQERPQTRSRGAAEAVTRGERVFARSYTLLASLLVPVAIVLLIVGSGAAHGVGIALLVVGLLAMAVPISPFLRARVRRREARAGRGQ
jgi:hypothetical protein